jgi:hypothetical protein
MRNEREHILQVILLTRLKAEECRYPELRLIYAIPNAGQRHPAVGAKFKAEGLRAGFPDLCLPVARGGYFGLYLEMKAEDGRLRPEQRDWLKALKEQGYQTAVAFGDDEGYRIVMNYLGQACTACTVLEGDS